MQIESLTKELKRSKELCDNLEKSTTKPILESGSTENHLEFNKNVIDLRQEVDF